MSDKSAISWTDATWNVFRGCSVVSPGCANCYAPESATRFLLGHYPDGRPKPYEGLVKILPSGKAVWTGEVRFVPELLDWPLRKQGPKNLGRSWRIFVNSMSDLFHEKITDEQLDQVFDVMEANPHGHTFQILTKRPERMRDYMRYRARWRAFQERYSDTPYNDQRAYEHYAEDYPHIWLGTSVEDQQRAEERIPFLVQTPAAVRFLSCEPLLGPLDLTPWLWEYRHDPGGPRLVMPPWKEPRGALHWVIDGGESGRNYRPDDQAWYRSIRDQCTAASVAYFHKQSSGPHSGTGVELDGVIWHQFPGDDLSLPYPGATLPLTTREVHYGGSFSTDPDAVEVPQ